MANEITFNPQIIIPPDTNWNSIDFDDLFVQGYQEYVIFLKVTAGTFQFSVGKQGSATLSPSYTTTDEVPPLTLSNDAKVLYYKAASTSDRANIAQ